MDIPINQSVLVLNQDFGAINVCNVRRALGLVVRGKAEVLEITDQPIHTIERVLDTPLVIRLAVQVRRPPPHPGLSRRGIFARDDYTCQYCGLRTHDLTLDHVVPRHRGGRDSWDNLVAACRPCNHRKGGKAPAEARMRLLREPREPRPSLSQHVARLLPPAYHAAWGPYVQVGSRQ